MCALCGTHTISGSRRPGFAIAVHTKKRLLGLLWNPMLGALSLSLCCWPVESGRSHLSTAQASLISPLAMYGRVS